MAESIRRAYPQVLSAADEAGRQPRCGICGWVGESFAAFSKKSARLVRCPECLSLGRDRHLHDLVVGNGGIDPDATVLDVAPSACLMNLFAPNSIYLAVDYAPTSPLVMRSDVRRLPFADQSFDVVLCSHVLEHIRDDRAAIHELHRVLHAGGHAFIQVPYRQSPKTVDFAEVDHHGHVRAYGRDDFIARLEATGFHVDARSLVTQALPENLYDEYEIFVCTDVSRSPVAREDSFLADLNRRLYRSERAENERLSRPIKHTPLAT